MKLRMYFETSVFSAYDDDQTPDRQHQTEEFWPRLDAFEAATSELAREELAQSYNGLMEALLGAEPARLSADERPRPWLHTRRFAWTI